MLKHFEIEIKSLLGSKEKADKFRTNITSINLGAKLVDQNSQLNHYFIGVEGVVLNKLRNGITLHLDRDKMEEVDNVISKGKDLSIRTRDLDGKVFFVIKASIDETASSNGIARIEVEAVIEDLTLEKLDRLLIDSGLSYQAKWSRQREEYKIKDITITIDKNAGYGYLAEFEKIVNDEDQSENVTKELRELMDELEVVELAQDRLERMFDYYNKHWEEYYGTDKIFNIE